MFNMTSGGSPLSNRDSGKKERLLVVSVGPGRDGCKIVRPEKKPNITYIITSYPVIRSLELLNRY